MLRNSAVILFLLAFGLMLTGCETTAGLAKGVAGTVVATGNGVVQDTKTTVNFLQKADKWVQKNLW